MRKVRLWVVLCSAPICFLLSLLAQSAPNRYRNELEPLIEKLMQQQQIPGLAIAIVENNQIVYARGFGRRTSARNVRMTRSQDGHFFTWPRLPRPLWLRRSCNSQSRGKLILICR